MMLWLQHYLTQNFVCQHLTVRSFSSLQYHKSTISLNTDHILHIRLHFYCSSFSCEKAKLRFAAPWNLCYRAYIPVNIDSSVKWVKNLFVNFSAIFFSQQLLTTRTLRLHWDFICSIFYIHWNYHNYKPISSNSCLKWHSVDKTNI